jgi:hypothetical protein
MLEDVNLYHEVSYDLKRSAVNHTLHMCEIAVYHISETKFCKELEAYFTLTAILISDMTIRTKILACMRNEVIKII